MLPLSCILLLLLTIVVENHDLHDAGPAELECVAVLALDVGQLQEELLVRLPLVVVNDRHSNLTKLMG